MITTVSVTTITSVTTIAAMGLTAALSIATAVILIFMLATRELVLVRGDGLASRLGRYISIGIVPLLLAFGVVLVIRLIEVLH